MNFSRICDTSPALRHGHCGQSQRWDCATKRSGVLGNSELGKADEKEEVSVAGGH